MDSKKEGHVRPGAQWSRLVKNRAFVGELIANPEATYAKYGIQMSQAEYVAIAGLADDLYAHAGKVLGDARADQNCSDHCQQNCHAFGGVEAAVRGG